jgi:hypothetical protein
VTYMKLVGLSACLVTGYGVIRESWHVITVSRVVMVSGLETLIKEYGGHAMAQ